MVKKILLAVLLAVACIALTGCGNDDAKDAEEAQKALEQFGQVISELSEGTETKTEASDLKLYSDDTKIVFDEGDSSYIVFYYSGEEITGHALYVNYESATLANIALQAVTEEMDEDIEKAYTQGGYLVVEYAKDEYDGYTTSEIRAIYSYLEEAKKAD